MQRTSTGTRKFSPFFNVNAMQQGLGGVIDWARLPASGFQVGKFTVKLAEAVDFGETAITVDALLHALKKGAVIDFGEQETVTVELSGNEAIGQTTLSVNALSGALPGGALLDFGAGENVVKVVPGGAAEGATTIDIVEALTVALETGDTATFQGGRKTLVLAADAAEGATSITAQPAQFPLADDSEGTADKSGTNDARFIPIGTVMARSAESGKEGMLIPRSIANGSTEVATEILRSDAFENSAVAAKSGYGTVKTGGLYENLMPDANSSGDIPSGYKTELATAGCQFWYDDWYDSRAAA